MNNKNDNKILITIYHANQCDKKKCTGWKLYHLRHHIKYSQIRIVKKLDRIPHSSLVLNPLAEKALSAEDSEKIKANGLVALDCSWKHAEPFFKRKYVVSRALPFLLAANPVNYGKILKLSTVEALSAAIIVAGLDRNIAKELLGKFRWGHSFLSLNRRPLKEYSKAKSSKEIIQIQDQYLS